MRFPKYLTTIVVMSILTGGSVATAQVKSYKEWKKERVTTAYRKVQITKQQIDVKRTVKAASITDPNLPKRAHIEAVAISDGSVERLEHNLKDELYSLETAQDLTVTDYFVGYLTKIQNREAAFNEVAVKLTPDEVAELMTAYANSVFGTVPAQKNLPTGSAITQ